VGKKAINYTIAIALRAMCVLKGVGKHQKDVPRKKIASIAGIYS